MIQTSSGYLAAVNSTSREWSARLLDGNNTPLSCEIMGVEVHKGTRGRDYQLGTMYAPHFAGTIRGYTGALMGETLQFQLGLEVSGSTEWVTICTGTVYQITENGDDLSFTAAGVLATAGDLIVTEQGTDIADIITDIETLTGVTVSAVGAASTIGLTGALAQSMDGLDVRTALQYLAGVFGGFVSEGADGGIVIGNIYSGTQVQVTDDEIQKLPDSSGSFDITGFEVVVTAGGVDASGTVIPDVSYTDGTVALSSVNPYMTAALFNSVKSYVTGLTVYAGAIEQTMGNPLIEPWDIVYNDANSDLRGSEIVITYNGGVSCSITSELTTTEEVSTVQTGPMSAQISKIEDKLYTIQDGLNYFWVDSSGAHVTQVPKDQFLASPQGGNTLIDSNGLAVRDGDTVLAGFSSEGVSIGPAGGARTAVTSTDMTFSTKDGLQVFALSSAAASGSKRVSVQLDPQYASKTSTPTSDRWTWELPSAPNGNLTMSFNNAIFPAGYAITILTGTPKTTTSTVDGVTYTFTFFCSTTGDEAYIEITRGDRDNTIRRAVAAYTTTAHSPHMAFGEGTSVSYSDQTAIGRYNDNDSGNLFEIGNGTDSSNRSNAFTVSLDGIPSFRNPANTFGTVFDLIYPVGSIYMSVNNVDPGTLFGGTWVQIQDTFLLAAGTNHAAGSTGGAETVTLTAAQSGLPAHTHDFTQPTVNGGADSGAITGGTHGHTANYRSVYSGGSNYSAATPQNGTSTSSGVIVSTSGSHTHNLPAHTHSVSGGAVGAVTGGAKAASSAHNNMPPYLAVYVWKRTA